MRRAIASLLATVSLGTAGVALWWQRARQPVSRDPNTELVRVEIPAGTPAQRIGTILVERDLIRSEVAWQVWLLWQQQLQQREGSPQAGTYSLSPYQSLSEIAEAIWNGDVASKAVAIPEGWTRAQMAARFAELGWFSAEDFLAATAEIPRDRFPWLPPDLPHLEGFLFPDTYFFPVGARPTAVEIRDRLLARFEAAALPIHRNAVETGYTTSLLDWATLGSLVEKEAVVAAERGVIAGVFANRLARNMPLASDPTVEYGLGLTQTPDRPLTLAEVRMPSPYNTYLNPGLPPTPIASPGLASLQAALAPEPTEYLFFVARYDGTHVFSRTYAEHSRAQQEIRRQRSQ